MIRLVNQKLTFFSFLEKSIDVRFHVLNHFLKFQIKIFIIVDEN